MKQLRNSARLVLLAMVILSGLLSTASASYAQGNATSFVSPMTGIPINTTGPWTIDTTSVYSQDGIESITLWGPTELMSVWFLPGNTPLVEARDIVLDSYAQTFDTFVEIDRGAYGNVSYSLDITVSEGIEFGVFSLFLGQRSSGYVEYYVFFGSLSLFAQGFASAQQNVRVNNNAIFDGVDGVGLQNLLLQNAGVTGASSGTTTTQAPPPPQPTQPPADTGQTGTTASPEGQAYLAALDAELTYLQGTVGTFLTNFSMQSEVQAQELVRIGNEWSSYQQRASGIVAPPGFEAIDAQYREIVASVSNLGVLWQGVITSVQNNDGTFGSKMIDLTLEVTLLDAQITDLKTTIANQGTGTTTTVPQPTQDTTTTAPQPTQPPADPGQTGATGMTPEQAAYLDSIRAETARLQTSLDDFDAKFRSLSDGTSPDTQQTAQEIVGILEMWQAMPQTATQFVAPAGMEDVDAAYKLLADDFAMAASTFNTAVQQQQANDPQYETTIQAFMTLLDSLGSRINDLNTLIDQKTQGTQSTTTTTAPQPTQPPADPGQTGTNGAPDGDAYLATISTEMDNVQASIDSFWEGLELLGADDQASQDRGGQLVNDAVAYWTSYGDVAAGIVAPAGSESVDVQYRELASNVSLLPQYFATFLDTPAGPAKDQARDEFIALINSVESQISTLRSELGETSTSTTTEPTQPAGGQTDVTETGNRGQLPNLPGDPRNTGSTSANADLEDLGFVEEGEYVSPQFDVEVIWDDRFEFDPDYLDMTIGSDEENGEDFITLVWTAGEGSITVSVIEADGFDPDEVLEFWESDEHLDSFDGGADVLLADVSSDRAGILLLVGDPENGTARYLEAFCIDRQCTQVALITVISPIDDAADIIADAEEAVDVDGESSTGVFSTRQISRALP